MGEGALPRVTCAAYALLGSQHVPDDRRAGEPGLDVPHWREGARVRRRDPFRSAARLHSRRVHPLGRATRTRLVVQGQRRRASCASRARTTSSKTVTPWRSASTSKNRPMSAHLRRSIRGSCHLSPGPEPRRARRTANAAGRASCAAPQITLTPSTGTAGSSVVVKGQYFADGCNDVVINGSSPNRLRSRRASRSRSNRTAAAGLWEPSMLERTTRSRFLPPLRSTRRSVPRSSRHRSRPPTSR